MIRGRAGVVAIVAGLLATTSVTPAPAQSPRRAAAQSDTVPSNVRAHAGLAVVQRLLRGPSFEERRQGAERAAALGTTEAVAALAGAAEASTTVRDGRFALVLARALSRFADSDRGRAGLLALAAAPSAATSSREVSAREPSRGEPELAARVELARHVAALAVAERGGDKGVGALAALARGDGPGQAAALAAFDAYPPRTLPFSAKTTLPAAALSHVAASGDLRALGALHAAARSQDPRVRAEALRALADAGDARVLPLARASLAERDVRLRVAAAEALVTLHAPESTRVVAALLADDATAHAGTELAARLPAIELLEPLARLARSGDPSIALSAVHALGRSPHATAVRTLASAETLAGPLAYPAAHALARSPAREAEDVLARLAAQPSTRRLALRAYVVRAVERDVRIGALDDVASSLARSSRPDERALGVFAEIALGRRDLDAGLAEPDPAVRRAAIVAARPGAARDASFRARLLREPDLSVRVLLADGLFADVDDGAIPTSYLTARRDAAGPDAPAAAFVLARRVDDESLGGAAALLEADDRLVRAAAARGLGFAQAPSVTSLLADAYAFETDTRVREAIVEALVRRAADGDAPARATTLDLARRLDPDARVRRRARGEPSSSEGRGLPSATWIAATTSGAEPWLGTLVPFRGAARTFAFDAEGFALVVGEAVGPTRLVLAPRLPAYEANAR